MKLILLISAFLFASSVWAGKASIELKKSTSVDVFDEKPWPNETEEMFQERQKIVKSCTEKSNRSEMSSQEYSEFYDCWLDGVMGKNYPLNENTKVDMAPQVPKADFTVLHYCGNRHEGYMLHLGDTSSIVIDARIFKNGKHIKDTQLVAGSKNGHYHKTGDDEGRVDFKEVLISTDDGVKKSRILSSKEKGTRIDLDGTELKCMSMPPTYQPGDYRRNQKSNQ